MAGAGAHGEDQARGKAAGGARELRGRLTPPPPPACLARSIDRRAVRSFPADWLFALLFIAAAYGFEFKLPYERAILPNDLTNDFAYPHKNASTVSKELLVVLAAGIPMVVIASRHGRGSADGQTRAAAWRLMRRATARAAMR